jgi:hypothetical protein
MNKTTIPILTACALAGSFVSAQNTTWVGGNGTNWSAADNWTDGTPVAGGNLTFNGTTNLISTNDLTWNSTNALGQNGTVILFGNGTATTQSAGATSP